MSVARQQTESSTVSRVLAGTTLALKVAREATDSVSIAKQILGSAAHISEFAEKIEKNRKAMNDLIAKSAEYACHIDTIVAGRIVEGKVLSNLRRLRSVFTRIEELMAEAAAVQNGVKRRLYTIFIAPNKASELSSELEKEIKLFELAMTLDVRLAISETAQETLRAIHENDLYDSDGFRRLRSADVRKLENSWPEDSNVTFAKARVDGELMVIRHAQRSTVSLPSNWATYLDIVKQLSYPRTQHANIIQLYGQSAGNPDNFFVAFRSGCHKFRDYVEQYNADKSPQQNAAKAFEVAIKLLNASRHLERVLNLEWFCQDFYGNFAVDDECNPTIGLFDDFSPQLDKAYSNSILDLDWVIAVWFTTYTSQYVAVRDLQVFRAIVSEFNIPHEILQLLQRLQDVNMHADLTSQSIPIDYPPTSLVPATVAHARDYLQALLQRPDTDLELKHFQPRAHILSSHQCESIWAFQYYLDPDSDSMYLGRCWIENGSRRYEAVSFALDDELAVECRAILGYDDRRLFARFEYRNDLGWLNHPRQRQK